MAASSKRMGNLSAAFEKANSQCEQLFDTYSQHSRIETILNNREPWIYQNNSRTVKNSTKNLNINYSLIFFHLYRAEKDDGNRSS
jgi:hypothetical protein